MAIPTVNTLSEEELKLAISSQLGGHDPTCLVVEMLDVSLIRAGDTVFHHKVVKTVCPQDIKYGGFMGTGLFGDSYRSGRDPAIRIRFRLRPTETEQR